MDNYPEDIHQYDNDPRSPFFDEDHAEELSEEDLADRQYDIIKNED